MECKLVEFWKSKEESISDLFTKRDAISGCECRHCEDARKNFNDNSIPENAISAIRHELLERARTVEASERVETGSIRFGNDWPGFFIRGDDAHSYANHLSNIISDSPNSLASEVLRGLLSQLIRSDLHHSEHRSVMLHPYVECKAR